MNLFSIAIKNIKSNFKNYFLYFVSMVFSVMIYFTFTSIQYNEQIVELVNKRAKIMGAFNASAVIILLFSAVFIWYSNSFFTKKRKKEIGLYSMLGVKKKQIGRMLFYETIAMGVLALVVGIGLGALLSKFFIMILVNLMGSAIVVKFAISMKAIIQTFIVFFILFLITSIHGYSLIYRFKLIELFKAESKAEGEPKASIILAVFSVILLSVAYAVSFHIFEGNFLLRMMFVLFGSIIATYILFSSFIVFLIKKSKKNKRKYYKGMNIISTSQLLYRIKGNARTLATIAILSATTITTMGTAASFYYQSVIKTREQVPFDYAYRHNEYKNIDNEIESIINKYEDNKLKNKIQVKFIEKDIKLPNIVKIAGSSDEMQEASISIISESSFKEIDKALNNKFNFELKKDEMAYFPQFFSPALMRKFEGEKAIIDLDGQSKELTVAKFSEKPLIPIYMTNEIVVVKDELYNKLYSEDNSTTISLFNVENYLKAEGLTNELESFIDSKSVDNESYRPGFTSFYSVYKQSMEFGGLFIFIGSFLGLVFLICTGSIIFFKQLSEASEEKPRYIILKKIGVNQKEIKKSISKQVLVVFLLPLLMGIMHSLFALRILDAMMGGLMTPIMITIVVYVIIYSIFYVLTVISYNNIVNEKL